MTKVLSLINNHLKSQDQRIQILEEEIKTFLKQSNYEPEHNSILNRLSSLEDRTNQTSKRVSNLSNDIHNLEANFNQTLETQISNILVSTNTRIRNAAQSFDAQFEIVNNQIQLLKKKIESLNNEDERVDLTVFGNFIKQNTIDIEELSKKLDIISSQFFTANPEAIANFGNPRPPEKHAHTEIDTSGLNMKISDNSTLLNQINQQKEVLLEVVSELNKIKEKMEMPLMQPPQIIETKTIIEERLVDPRKNAMSNRTATVNGNLNTVKLETELSKLENDFDSHQSKVVAAMNAIQFELQQIRDHGEGLKGLPPLNLANVVPSFFNNPSFSFSREKEEEDSYEIDENQSIDENRSQNEIENINEIQINRDKKPEHFIKARITEIYSDDEADESDIADVKDIKMKKKKKKEEEEIESDGTFSDGKGSSPSLIQRPEISESEILEKIRKELEIESIKKSFETINKEYKEVMSSIERKIDRDYVERLFDKFRSLIHGINERVKELADLNSDFATRQDFINLVQFVKKLPKEFELKPGTVLKKGPACLFCGKPKTSLVGSIPSSIAANAGKPPVGSIVSDANGIEYVYGEGHAFLKNDLNFQSFPRFDALPPLEKLSMADNNNNNSKELNNNNAKELNNNSKES